MAELEQDHESYELGMHTEQLSGRTQHDHTTPLHHESRECARSATDDNGAAFLIDAGATTHIALADQIAVVLGHLPRIVSRFLIFFVITVTWLRTPIMVTKCLASVNWLPKS